MIYEDLAYIYSEDSLRQFFNQTNQRNYLWQIAMPKSGSTWLSNILTSIYINEGWEVSRLVPDYDRRNQEIDPRYFFLKGNHASNVFFVQQHCEYSAYTGYLIKQSRMKCILQVRNLFDVAVSLFDHLKSLIGSNNPEKNVLPSGSDVWTDDKLMNYVINISMPWYFKFIEGWYNSPLMKENKLIVISYEQPIKTPASCVNTIIKTAELTLNKTNVNSILNTCQNQNIRFNKGVIGRGKFVLTGKQIDSIFSLASYCNLDKNFELLSLN